MRRWLISGSLVALALGSSVTNLRNRYAQDDMGIIQKNSVVHSLADPGRFFTESYWPKPFSPALYRPLSTTSYALQWAVGDGRPIVFRIVSNLLYLATTLAVFALATRLLPPLAAWLAAAFFAVHPVHVESVAVAVNQSEQVVGLIAALLVLRYLGIRDRGAMTWRDGAVVFGLYLTALMFKESGLVLIGLVVAAELTLVRRDRPLWRRLNEIRPLLLVMLLGATAFFALRTFALEGNARGTFTAEALEGLSIGGRALTMLTVVPHWFRLLLWPAHLRGDYSPREIETSTGFGLAEAEGVLLLVLAVLILIAAWRRAPVAAFGILWTGIGIFPVSNVLVPTGIVVAERVLFLASIGMMITIGALAVPLIGWLGSRPKVFSRLAAGAVAAILVMGLTRSASRQRVWQDQFTFWYQTTIDAPTSYRAHHALASLLFPIGARVWAEREYRTAIALYPKQWGATFDLANKLRLEGQCEQAVWHYRQALRADPELESARTSVIACFLHMGRYGDAVAEAREAMSYATRPPRLRLFQRLFVIADSAARVGAAPGTVRVTVADRDTMP
ncbi:MAG: hypothetical protein FJ206_13640 [Gemmatimonadetes bacterium]|nr:hypothetical protein [Gemmatimonadota bacterium]